MSLKSVLICLCTLNSITGICAWAPYPLFEDTIYDYTQPEHLFTKNRRSLNLGNAEDFRNAVFEVCRYNFAGAWNLITAQQMRFYELNRSLNDRWYYCGLPFNMKPLYREYGEAAVVFYGPGRRHPENTNTQSMVQAYFSQKQGQQYSTLLTPRILGSFPGGRIEEYWQNSLVADNTNVPNIAKDVLKKLAYIHGLNPPAPRSIGHFWHRVSTILSLIRRAQFSQKVVKHLPKQRAILNEVLLANLEAEALWLRNYLDQLGAPIVFSHSNPRVDQIYLRRFGNPDNKLTFLNLGWGQYLYRSYDMADFILEAAIDMSGELPYPHFKVNPNFVPTPKQLSEWISFYLQSMTPMEREWPSAVHTIDAMFQELERTTLLSHFYNSVQALLSSFYNFGKKFGYPEYSKTRLDMYYDLKNRIIKQKGLKISLFATITNPNQLIDTGYPGARQIGLSDRLHLDPFAIPTDSMSRNIFPQNCITNQCDLDFCQKLVQNRNLRNQDLTALSNPIAVNPSFVATRHTFVGYMPNNTTLSINKYQNEPPLITGALNQYQNGYNSKQHANFNQVQNLAGVTFNVQNIEKAPVQRYITNNLNQNHHSRDKLQSNIIGTGSFINKIQPNLGVNQILVKGPPQQQLPYTVYPGTNNFWQINKGQNLAVPGQALPVPATNPFQNIKQGQNSVNINSQEILNRNVNLLHYPLPRSNIDVNRVNQAQNYYFNNLNQMKRASGIPFYSNLKQTQNVNTLKSENNKFFQLNQGQNTAFLNQYGNVVQNNHNVKLYQAQNSIKSQNFGTQKQTSDGLTRSFQPINGVNLNYLNNLPSSYPAPKLFVQNQNQNLARAAHLPARSLVLNKDQGQISQTSNLNNFKNQINFQPYSVNNLNQAQNFVKLNPINFGNIQAFNKLGQNVLANTANMGTPAYYSMGQQFGSNNFQQINQPRTLPNFLPDLNQNQHSIGQSYSALINNLPAQVFKEQTFNLNQEHNSRLYPIQSTLSLFNQTNNFGNQMSQITNFNQLEAYKNVAGAITNNLLGSNQRQSYGNSNLQTNFNNLGVGSPVVTEPLPNVLGLRSLGQPQGYRSINLNQGQPLIGFNQLNHGYNFAQQIGSGAQFINNNLLPNFARTYQGQNSVGANYQGNAASNQLYNSVPLLNNMAKNIPQLTVMPQIISNLHFDNNMRQFHQIAAPFLKGQGQNINSNLANSLNGIQNLIQLQTGFHRYEEPSLPYFPFAHNFQGQNIQTTQTNNLNRENQLPGLYLKSNALNLNLGGQAYNLKQIPVSPSLNKVASLNSGFNKLNTLLNKGKNYARSNLQQNVANYVSQVPAATKYLANKLVGPIAQATIFNQVTQNMAQHNAQTYNISQFGNSGAGLNVGATNLNMQLNGGQNYQDLNLKSIAANKLNQAPIVLSSLNTAQKLGANNFEQFNQDQNLRHQAQTYNNMKNIPNSMFGLLKPALLNQGQNYAISNLLGRPPNNMNFQHAQLNGLSQVQRSMGQISGAKTFNQQNRAQNFGFNANNMKQFQNSVGGPSYATNNVWKSINGQNLATSNKLASFNNQMNQFYQSTAGPYARVDNLANINQGSNFASFQTNVINKLDQVQSQANSLGYQTNSQLIGTGSFPKQIQPNLGVNQISFKGMPALQQQSPLPLPLPLTLPVQSNIDQIFLDPDFDSTYMLVPIIKEVILADKPELDVQ